MCARHYTPNKDATRSPVRVDPPTLRDTCTPPPPAAHRPPPTTRSVQLELAVGVAKLGLVALEEVDELLDVEAVPVVDLLLRGLGDFGQHHGVPHHRLHGNVAAGQQRAPPDAPAGEDGHLEALEDPQAQVRADVQGAVRVRLPERVADAKRVPVLERVLDEALALLFGVGVRGGDNREKKAGRQSAHSCFPRPPTNHLHLTADQPHLDVDPLVAVLAQDDLLGAAGEQPQGRLLRHELEHLALGGGARAAEGEDEVPDERHLEEEGLHQRQGVGLHVVEGLGHVLVRDPRVDARRGAVLDEALWFV